MTRINSRLWNSNTNVRVWGWASILEQWNHSLFMPSEVETILENLKEACNPDSNYEPPLSKFLNFLNNEQAGISWFLFEAITHRWMWATPRLDYVRDLVDEIENLDSPFPDFPGSPGPLTTIRQWVTDNLTRAELEVVQMIPPLENAWNSWHYDAQPALSYPLPPSPNSAYAHADYTTPTRPTQPVAPLAPARKKMAPIQFRMIRDTKSSKSDDILTVSKEEDFNTYAMKYVDNESHIKYSTKNLTGQQLIDSLRMTLRFLSVDEMPFEYLQVTLPSMPSIMVKPENLTSQTRDLIYDSVEATMANWPKSSA